jgi:hypothetical protein
MPPSPSAEHRDRASAHSNRRSHRRAAPFLSDRDRRTSHAATVRRSLARWKSRESSQASGCPSCLPRCTASESSSSESDGPSPPSRVELEPPGPLRHPGPNCPTVRPCSGRLSARPSTRACIHWQVIGAQAPCPHWPIRVCPCRPGPSWCETPFPNSPVIICTPSWAGPAELAGSTPRHRTATHPADSGQRGAGAG